VAHITIEQALEEIKQGKMVILADGKEPENEGDFCLAAESVTPEAVNFMAKHGRGLICLSLSRQKVQELDLPPMVDNNTSRYGTGFTVSIDGGDGGDAGAGRVCEIASQVSGKGACPCG